MPVNNLIITNAGSAALVAAAANGTNAVTIVSCGLSSLHNVYNAASNALIGQFKTIANISGGAIDPATIHLAFADQSADAYDLRAIALYLNDGTLFAIYSQSTPIITKISGVDGVLSVNIKLLNNNSSQILFGNTNIFNPPSTENSIGVIEIATQTETNTGTDDARAITPKKLTAFWNNKAAWTVSNDGAGSGLDADLLDGQHGTYYLDLANATGTLPSARLGGNYNISISGNAATADNATNATNSNNLGNILAANYWHSGNDGAGSGLDADLLDGFDSSSFAKIATSNIFTAPQSIVLATGQPTLDIARTGTTGTDFPQITLRTASRYDRIQNTANGISFGYNYSGVEKLAVWNGADFTINGTIAWHAGNDGAGSGLDADLFDGLDSSAFAKLSGATFTGNVKAPEFVLENVDLAQKQLRFTFSAGNSIFLYGAAGSFGLWDTLGGGVFGYAPSSSTFNFYKNLLINSNSVWHAGNDGSGSGLDADLLDGFDSSSFAKLSGATFTGPVNDASGSLRSLPQNAKTAAYVLVAADNGKHISITTGGVTIPAGIFSIGDSVAIFNNSAVNQIITQGVGVTLYLVGTNSTGNRTLAQRGLATIVCVAANTFVIIGGGLT